MGRRYRRTLQPHEKICKLPCETPSYEEDGPESSVPRLTVTVQYSVEIKTNVTAPELIYLDTTVLYGANT